MLLFRELITLLKIYLILTAQVGLYGISKTEIMILQIVNLHGQIIKQQYVNFSLDRQVCCKVI